MVGGGLWYPAHHLPRRVSIPGCSIWEFYAASPVIGTIANARANPYTNSPAHF